MSLATGSPAPLKRISFSPAKPTRIQVHSPNIYKRAVKHLPATSPPFVGKPTQPIVQKSTPHPPPFPGSLQALPPDQLDSTITSTFTKEEAITAPAKEVIGKTMYPRSFALSHSTAPMLDRWGRQGCHADCGKVWDKEQITAAIRWGSH